MTNYLCLVNYWLRIILGLFSLLLSRSLFFLSFFLNFWLFLFFLDLFRCLSRVWRSSTSWRLNRLFVVLLGFQLLLCFSVRNNQLQYFTWALVKAQSVNYFVKVFRVSSQVRSYNNSVLLDVLTENLLWWLLDFRLFFLNYYWLLFFFLDFNWTFLLFNWLWFVWFRLGFLNFLLFNYFLDIFLNFWFTWNYRLQENHFANFFNWCIWHSIGDFQVHLKLSS